MKDTIALAMVIIAYALGHFGGYRLCKHRVKNRLLHLIKSGREVNNAGAYATTVQAQITSVYSRLLREITEL